MKKVYRCALCRYFYEGDLANLLANEDGYCCSACYGGAVYHAEVEDHAPFCNAHLPESREESVFLTFSTMGNE